MPGRLSGKVCIVTGTGGSMGRATALTFARELAHSQSLAFALFFTATLHQFRRERPAVQERVEALIALSTEQGFPSWFAVATILQGWLLAEQGAGEAGIAQMRQGLSDFQSMLAHSRRGIVYYAGHGVKVGDHSILVPVDLGEVSAARLTQVGLKLRQLVTTLAPA